MNGTSKSERRPRGLRSLAGIVVFLVLGHVTLIPTNAADTPQTGSFKPAANVQDDDDASAETSPRPEFDGEFAYEWLKKICNLGPRVSGSEGMKRQQEMLQQYFQELGADVRKQRFKVRHPETGRQVEMVNLIVRFHPERKKRLMFCCHYDTRPYADRDPVNPRAPFLGANDGASGVGFLCELGRHIPPMDGNYGVDLVFFDGEEFVFVYRRDPMFIGSTHFAEEYAKGRTRGRYNFAVLVDMIGDKELEIFVEGNSLEMAPRLTRSIWAVARQLNVDEFRQEQKHKLRDDHLPLNSIARIPTVDIIDFDYPRPGTNNAYWHTQQDIPENCSAESLEKVGRVLLEWLRQMQELSKQGAR